jgi:lipopolysaccharide/colanic/teichoic acid biosynthesis glycosyltransferase
MEELVSELDRELSWPAAPTRQNSIIDKRAWFLVEERRVDILICILDVITSLALLLSTLPLMMLVSILVGIDSPGPVFCRQIWVIPTAPRSRMPG